MYVQDFGGSYNGGSITNTDPNSWDGLYVINSGTKGLSGDKKHEPSVFSEEYDFNSSQKVARNFNLSNLTITGFGLTDSWGVYYRSNSDVLSGNMTNCTVTGWDWGIYTREAGGTVTLVANQNKILGNTTWGFYSNTAISQDAKYNWWGHASWTL